MAYRYEKTLKGTFISRPNRFIAEVEINGRTEICHVKNTGRCRELLVKGVTVILEESLNPARKTKYDLIAVYKGERLVNIDSQVPNKCAAEAVPQLFEGVKLVKPEFKFGSSRIDFYIETEEKKILMEVKGVTLENNGVVSFPDAPTERGVKHLHELSEAVSQGYEACVLFVVQLEGAERFEPNRATNPEFAEALAQAEKCGVRVMVYGCKITEDTILIDVSAEISRDSICY
ncbi:MAG: DNA/RNA nuclease SfsA [Oscillospiraceae bacterium]|nr:DNA/RNA nuclease SfsA [Oscillospiraceae bacterium]